MVILYPGLVNTQTLTAGRTRLYTYKHTTATLTHVPTVLWDATYVTSPVHHRLHKEGKHNQHD